MGSQGFRIIPHQVAEATNPAVPDLYRYIIAFSGSDQPQFVAADRDGHLILVSDEKSALRFDSIEGAERRLAVAKHSCELELSGFAHVDFQTALH